MRNPRRRVVKSDRFRNTNRESPQAEQVGSDFGMGDSPEFFFDLVQGLVLLARPRQEPRKAVWHFPSENQLADIMQQGRNDGGVSGASRQVHSPRNLCGKASVDLQFLHRESRYRF